MHATHGMNSIPFCLSRRYLARRRKPGEFFGYIWATRCCAARRRGVTWHLRTDGAACRSSYELNDFHPGCRVTRVLGVSVRVNVGQFPFHSLVLWRWRAVFLKEGSISLYCDIFRLFNFCSINLFIYVVLGYHIRWWNKSCTQCVVNIQRTNCKESELL